MGSNFLSARSWLVFLGAESILAGVLIVLNTFSGWALIAAGVVILATLWAWERYDLSDKLRKTQTYRWLRSYRLQWSLTRGRIAERDALTSERLYVSRININVERLHDDSYITICIDGFNGTPFSLIVKEITGFIYCWLPTVDNPNATELSPPYLRRLSFGSTLEPYKRFTIELEQRVPGKTKDVMLDWLTKGNKIELNLSKLSIIVKSADDIVMAIEMVLWGGVSFYQLSGRTFSKEVLYGKGNLMLRSSIGISDQHDGSS